MKSIFALVLVSMLPFAAVANEVVLSCKLKVIEEFTENDLKIEGTLTIEKVSTANLVMKVDAVASVEGAESEVIQSEDKVANYERKDETTIPTAEDFVASSSDLSAMREQMLDNQKVSSIEFYEGEGFQDDGNGLNLLRFVTVEGKVLNMVNVGWSFLLCE